MTQAEVVKANPPRGGAMIRATVSAVGAAMLLSLTGTPSAKTFARLQAIGVGDEVAGLLLHAAPVVMVGLLVPAGMMLGKKRSQAARFALYGALGGIVGFMTGYCLDLFSGFGAMIETMFGPQSPPRGIDVVAWVIVAFSFMLAVMGVLPALLGPRALRAAGVAEEGAAATARPQDRAVMIWAGVGLLGHGLLVLALIVLHQSEALSGAARVQLLGAFGLGVALFAWSSLVLWRRYDELYRLVVVRAYAWTGGIATSGLVGWTAFELAGYAPPLSVYVAAILILFLQFVVTIALSVKLTASHVA